MPQDNTDKLKKLTDAATKAGKKLVRPGDSTAQELFEAQRWNEQNKKALGLDIPSEGVGGASAPAKPMKSSPNTNTQYGSRPGEKRISDEELKEMTKPLGAPAKQGLGSIPLYDEGGDVKSGLGKINVNDGKHEVAVLENGEKVLTPSEAAAYNREHPEAKHGPLMSTDEVPEPLISSSNDDIMKNAPRIQDHVPTPRRASVRETIDNPETLSGIDALYNQNKASFSPIQGRFAHYAPEELVPIDAEGRMGSTTRGEESRDGRGAMHVTGRVPKDSMALIHTHPFGQRMETSDDDEKVANKLQRPNYALSGSHLFVAEPGNKNSREVAEIDYKNGHVKENWKDVPIPEPAYGGSVPLYDKGGDVANGAKKMNKSPLGRINLYDAGGDVSNQNFENISSGPLNNGGAGANTAPPETYADASRRRAPAKTSALSAGVGSVNGVRDEALDSPHYMPGGGPTEPAPAMPKIPLYDEGGDVDTDQTKPVVPPAETQGASPDDLIQQDKEEAAQKGDLVGLGKAVLADRHVVNPRVSALGRIDLPTTESSVSNPQPSTEMHQDVAGGPLVSGTSTHYDKGTTRDFASMDHKAKLSDYDQRIQRALDTGTPEGQTEADRLRAAKMEYQKQNPWGTAGNHPGILGKIGHIAAGIGNIGGDILSPALMELIPGTDLNRRARAAGLGSAISHDTEDELRVAQSNAANAKESPKPKLLTEAGNTYTSPEGTRYQRYSMTDGSAQWVPEGQAPAAKGLGSIPLPQGGFFGAEKPNSAEQDKNRWSTLLSKKQRGDNLSAQEQQDYQNLAPQFSIGDARANSINKNVDAILKDRGIPNDQWGSYHVDANTAPDVAKDAEHQADVRSNEVWTSGQPERQQSAEQRKQDEKDKRTKVYAEDDDGNLVYTSLYDAENRLKATPSSIQEVKPSDITRDKSAIRQLNDVQLNVSRYQRSIANDLPKVSPEDRSRMQEILALNDQSGQALLSVGGSGISISGISPTLEAKIKKSGFETAAKDLEALSPAARNVLNTYLRTAASVPAYQKALTNIGRSNKEMLELELANVPLPYFDAQTMSSRMDAFQENVDQARSGFPKNLPGLKLNTSGSSRTSRQEPPAGATGTARGSDGNWYYHDKNGSILGPAPKGE